MTVTKEVSALLRDGVADLGLDFSDQQFDQLEQYLFLLNRWNAVHNLTAVRTLKDQVVRHLLDCLSIVPYLANKRSIVDVGSGAGLPAIMIAIACPDTRVIAIESIQKKAAFIRQAVLSIKLDNLGVVAERVEAWRAAIQPDVIVSRAMASVDDLLMLTAHLGHNDTLWMLMKGREDISLSVPDFSIKKIVDMDVPQLDERRQLVLIKRI